MNNPQTIHKLKGYISFLETIPDEKWGSGFVHYKGRSCVLGHLSKNYNLTAIEALKQTGGKIHFANDGMLGYQDYGPTPKKRVLRYL